MCLKKLWWNCVYLHCCALLHMNQTFVSQECVLCMLTEPCHRGHSGLCVFMFIWLAWPPWWHENSFIKTIYGNKSLLWEDRADIYCTFWVLWQLSGYARGWAGLSNWDWLPSCQTVSVMLQCKYSLMFSFALYSQEDMSKSPLNARLHPGWPPTSHPVPKLPCPLTCSLTP